MKPLNLLQSQQQYKLLFSSLIEHYLMMKRVQQAGGLRKELTPEMCVIMHITFHNITNPLDAVILAAKVKYNAEQILSIPF